MSPHLILTSVVVRVDASFFMIRNEEVAFFSVAAAQPNMFGLAQPMPPKPRSKQPPHS
ncbi:MAG: hypothetical protein Q8P95_00250 [bacterium]|nr:hypothetical protein [bacterium]